jgi:multidrug efflux pump subunit AcrA (membrane-fusion protein)
MNRSTQIALRIILPLTILGVAVFGFVGLAGINQRSNPKPKPVLDPLVETVIAVNHTGGLIIRAHGNVVPFRQVPLPTEVTGRIEFKSEDCKAGRFVRASDELFRIDPEDYQLEVERIEKEQAQAAATVAEAQQEIVSAAELLTLAEEEFDQQNKQFLRVESLFKDGIATEDQYDKAKQSRRQANTALVTQKNQTGILEKRLHRFQKAFDLSGTMLKKANLDLSRTILLAPITGVIIAEYVEQDSFVQRGTELVLIADTSAAEVRFNLRMEDLFWLWQHEDVEPQTSQELEAVLTQTQTNAATWEVPQNVEVDVIYELGGQRFKWDGELSRFEGTGLDERTRTVPCRVLVSKPTAGIPISDHDQTRSKAPPALARGMFVSVEIKSKPRVRLIRIPERAVRPGNVVWRVRHGKLERLEVEIAQVVDGHALVPDFGETLAEGDHVVVSPLATETSGQRVREIPALPANTNDESL